ncbi:MAG: endo alpha-1,4 polygalactosaminidase [Cellulophaga sp.]|nr:endo alpha-1,4 polygalactosaminidase [Cellulophaga sp.]
MRHIKLFYFLLPFLATAQNATKSAKTDSFFICYGKIMPEKVFGYDVVILESQLYNTDEIKQFKAQNNTVIGYISLTEIHPTSTLYEKIKNYTFGKNDIWGSYYIDIAKPQAQEIIYQEVDSILQKGFDGLFMDNLDNASQWGVLKDHKCSLVQLVKEIKKRHSSIYLMQNAGLFVAKDLKNTTDSILIESVMTAYNFEKNEYAFREDTSKKNLLQELTTLKKECKKQIYILEYAASEKMKETIETSLSKTTFSFSVANIDLQHIPEFKNINN